MRRPCFAAIHTAVLVLLFGTLGLSLGLGTASAYFAAAGLGVGSGETGTAAAVTLTPGTVGVDLYPGASVTVATVISNPNPFSVQIAALALDPSQGSSGFTVDPDHAGCGLTTFSFATQSNGGSGWTVPANGTLAVSLPASVTATTATGNACQGATLTVYLRSTG